VRELFEARLGRLRCAACGGRGLSIESRGGEDDGDWGDVRCCEACGEPIAEARLQVFPDASLCVDCQQKEERREPVGGEREFCDRCGTVLEVRQSASRGLTRYVLYCPACRR